MSSPVTESPCFTSIKKNNLSGAKHLGQLGVGTG